MVNNITPTKSLIWHWRNLPIRYQVAGSQGEAMVLIHGFGASSDHWRKNLPVLAETHRVYAIDLVGFGQSAKPQPSDDISYTFETWGAQLVAFCQEVIGGSAFLVGNSIGCVVALQTAVLAPDLVLGVAMLNCSLRMLHDRKRSSLPWHQQLSTPLLQQALSYRPLGQFFFSQLAKPKIIRNLLLQAYGNQAAVTDELIELLLQPAYDPGAADVFLAFISYSQGPLPEDLLPQVNCPVFIAWGANDPWEPMNLGSALADFPSVVDFIPLPGIGHCPQDEAPELVNPILNNWVNQRGQSL